MQGIVVGRVCVCVGGEEMERASDDQRERDGVRGEKGEQVQMQLVRCPPMHHWYILQCN